MHIPCLKVLAILTLASQQLSGNFNLQGLLIGGVHEALIKYAKRALTKVLGEEQGARRHLREHEVRPTLYEVMGFLNSRPLTFESTDPDDARALTPNHFLIQRANVYVPPGVYAAKNPREHFHYVQGIVDRIWSRWTNEYLPNLLQ